MPPALLSRSLNTQTTNASVTLTPTGGAKIKASGISRLFQYESMAGITRLEPSHRKDYLRSGINLIQANINNIQINEAKEVIPMIDIQYTIETEQYGNKTGNRLFIPANIFRKGFTTPDLKQRVQDIHINYGYLYRQYLPANTGRIYYRISPQDLPSNKQLRKF